MSTNVELVQRLLEAFNEQKLEQFGDILADGFQWVTPTATNGEPRVYRGLDGIREFWVDASPTWGTIEGHVSEVRDLGDRVLVIGELRGRDPRGRRIEVVRPLCTVIHFEEGRISRVYTYRNEADAWAGAGLSRRGPQGGRRDPSASQA
jgi:ketosteroid isomerase-like protein